MERGDKMLKESIRKTIMMQEDIFKQQVKELHRLYHMQKKLMVEKGKQTKEKDELDLLRSSATPARSLCNTQISDVGNGSICSVFGTKRPHKNAISRSNSSNSSCFEDGCEVELSLSIRGKLSKQRSNSVLHQLKEGEIKCCLGSIGVGRTSSQSSSRSDPRNKYSQKKVQHLQLQLSI